MPIDGSNMEIGLKLFSSVAYDGRNGPLTRSRSKNRPDVHNFFQASISQHYMPLCVGNLNQQPSSDWANNLMPKPSVVSSPSTNP